jgi:tol-pal system-associated acyl-CoA thioesterase
MPHVLPVVIYYEDTDFTGVVYHPNYLKYFERAREELLGVERLARLYREKGHGFVVYKIEVQFKEPAVHGDRVEVRTIVRADSEYRMVFDQQVWRPSGNQPLVKGTVEMVTVDKAGKLVPIPEDILGWIRSSGAG